MSVHLYFGGHLLAQTCTTPLLLGRRSIAFGLSTFHVYSSELSRYATAKWFVPSFQVATPYQSRSRLQMLHTSPVAGKPPSELTVAVAGATGYIGKAVVRECVRRGYKTKAYVREESVERAKSLDYLKGAEVIGGSLDDSAEVEAKLFQEPVDVVISCIASRSGAPADAWKVDHQANVHLLDASLHAPTPAQHFVMLSAFCVRKPELVFQHAKLKFENYLRGKQDEITSTIIRPTAFFKSVSGQLEIVQKGYPYVMFGDGEICKCNPISEADLAEYIVKSIDDQSMHHQVLDVGGPDEGLTPKRQAEILFEVVGKEPRFIAVPIGLFDAIIGTIDFFAQFFDGAKDAAELARIGKYYAVEDMLATGGGEQYGQITLREHFARIAKEGNEYDPYTTMFSSKKEA